MNAPDASGAIDATDAAPTFTFDPERPESVEAASAAPEEPERSLDDYKFAKLQNEIAGLAQQLSERRDMHFIRRWHTWLLFGVTVCWIVVIWLVVLLEGFGQWFLPFPAPDFSTEEYLHFKLTNAVLIAFLTTTTATVLGLYSVAAYWLYGNGKTHSEKNEDKTKDSVKGKQPQKAVSRSKTTEHNPHHGDKDTKASEQDDNRRESEDDDSKEPAPDTTQTNADDADRESQDSEVKDDEEQGSVAAPSS